MSIKKYRTKIAAIVEAVKVSKDTLGMLIPWIAESKCVAASATPQSISIVIHDMDQQREFDAVATDGDYIVKCGDGAFFVCKANIFEQLYTDADDGRQ